FREEPNGGLTPVATAITGASPGSALGSFRFDLLLAGTYRLVETQPGSFNDGIDRPGSLGGTAGGPGVDTIAHIIAGPGDNGTGYLFGERPPASLGGRVYIDRNNNGILDTGVPGQPDEVGFNGVPIQLFREEPDGGLTLVATAVTGPSPGSGALGSF